MCLKFYIKLLNQTIYNKKYNIVLIYILIVLNIDLFNSKFRNFKTYLPILLFIIKVAYFIII